MHLNPHVPECFAPILMGNARFNGMSGGRGGAKSHTVGEALVIEAATSHIRSVCLREVQNSIKDSVKQLLEDKIDRLGLRRQCKSTLTEIVFPRYDSLFIFKGLQNHTATSIKSLEGFNRPWYEESQSLSKKSIEIATPTFRMPGTRQYFTWNPDQDTDPVDVFFRDNKGDPDFCHVTVNYFDNPWFPEDLRRDMERDRGRDPDKYQHIWLGGYRKSSEARVFRNFKIERFETPANARFLFGSDWGFATDPTVLLRMFIVGRTLYIDREVWAVGCEIDHIPYLFGGFNGWDVPPSQLPSFEAAKRQPWAQNGAWEGVPGSRKHWITADSARPETISYVQNHGFPMIRPAIKGPGSVEDGIEFLKSYDIVIHPDCWHTAYEFQMYSYVVDKKTGIITNELQDKDNHTIDAARYGVENVRRAPITKIEELRL